MAVKDIFKSLARKLLKSESNLSFEDLVKRKLEEFSKEQMVFFFLEVRNAFLAFIGYRRGFNFWERNERQKHLYSLIYSLDTVLSRAITETDYVIAEAIFKGSKKELRKVSKLASTANARDIKFGRKVARFNYEVTLTRKEFSRVNSLLEKEVAALGKAKNLAYKAAENTTSAYGFVRAAKIASEAVSDNSSSKEVIPSMVCNIICSANKVAENITSKVNPLKEMVFGIVTELITMYKILADLVYKMSGKENEILNVKHMILRDLDIIKKEETISHENYSRYHGDNWSLFQKALENEGCVYWARVYQNIFEKGLLVDVVGLTRRLNVPKKVRESGAAEVAHFLEESVENGKS